MLRVVVIDSNAISRNLMISVLETGGYQVMGDVSATAAGIASVTKLQPQLVCIDPSQNGQWDMDLLDTIRSVIPKALIFVVSGAMHPEQIYAAAQRSVHGFIVKPFNATTVLATIRKAVLKVAQQHQIVGTADAK